MVDVEWKWNNVDEWGNEDKEFILNSDIGFYRLIKHTIGKYNEDGEETVGDWAWLSVHTISAEDNGKEMCEKIKALFEESGYENIDVWTESVYNSYPKYMYAVSADIYSDEQELDTAFYNVVELFKKCEEHENLCVTN